ncbi:AAA family ATPase [Virgibacillus sp. DJP39]|uniref:ATP-binding protein n=1 Tax=Virgibacillus sp. DJP39 TaxID=3409790 RepID=UPI003BB53AC7
MEFIRASIYGFAKWHDFQLDFHPDELQVIYGENESGKSSLQQFILFMLFGLPPKKRNSFRSKTSGKMGGTLTVVDEDIGEYVIERIDEVRNGAARCLLSNGEEAGEEWLKGRLHGITRPTYESIFSFDALDLTSLKSMKEEDLGEVLLGVGLTGSTDIYAVEKRLDAKIGDLFKPFGKKPIINQQLDNLDYLYNKVQEYKSQEKMYSEKKGKRSETRSKIKELQLDIKSQKRNVDEAEKLRQALPSLQKLDKYRQKLKTYPDTLTFPEEGLNRFESLKDKILPLESELAVLNNNDVDQNRKHTELKNGLMITKTYDKVKELLNSKTAYYDLVKQKENLEDNIKEEEVELKNELQTIDSKLDFTKLNDVSLAYQTENTWIQLYEESQKLSIEQENSAHEEIVQQKQIQDLEEDLKKLKETCLPSQYVDELTNRIYSYNQSRIQDNNRKQNKNLEVIKKQKQKTSINILIGCITLGALLSLLGFLQGYSWCYFTAIALVGIGLFQWVMGKRSLQTLEQIIGSSTDQSNQANISLEEKEEAVELLTSHDETIQKIAALENQLQSKKVEQIKRKEGHLLIDQKLDRINERIRLQRDYYPILKTIDVNNWPSFYHMYKALLKRSHDLTNKKQLLENLIVEQSNLTERIKTFFYEQNWGSDFVTVDNCYTFLQKKVEDYNNNIQLMKQYESWITMTKEQINSIKQKLQVFKQEQFNLMKVAEVNTEEDFYQKHKSLKDKEELEAKKEDLIEQLRFVLSDEHIENIDFENITNITEKLKEYHASIESLEVKLEELRRVQAELTAELSTMESSDEYSEAMHRLELENTELNKLMEKWAVLKSAKEILVEAKSNYRNKYMSKIIHQTSEFFTILTNQSYINVFPPTKEQLFQVESANQVRYMITELSQGTKDQLYIALRLAISEVMSETHHMPFIIDDAFVHFDDIREEHMMRLITTISKKRQVLLFTCKRQLMNNHNVKNVTVLKESIRKM